MYPRVGVVIVRLFCFLICLWGCFSKGKIGIRYLQTFLLFLGMAFGYCLRVSISEAIVPMSEVYNWDQTKTSLIKSSFFWGYTVIQIPSGYIASVWSGQKLLSIGILVCGILNGLIPTAAAYGDYIAVCACRVGMGLCQGCLLPCIHTLLSKWAPPSERSRLGAFAYAGAQFGTVISFPISGVLAASSLAWPSIFFVFGGIALIWSIFFFIFGSDSPAQDSRISEEEREYIENSIRSDEGKKMLQDTGKKKTPWKAIFTSVPMWALIIVHCGQNWGYWTLVNELPNYMDKVLKFNYEQNGMLSALPYLVMWILSFPLCWLADYALKKGVSRGVVRKVCNTIAHWGPAVALSCLAALSIDNAIVAVGILVVAVGLNAGSLCGFQINHIDLSPNFAGTMMSITNCIASVIAIIAPLVCGAIAYEDTNAALWNIVFYLSAAIYVLGNLIFIIFGQAEVQPWNEPEAYELSTRKESPMA
ncbi:putative inorganic phosphate cotransporter [Osmia bicornis bicornis]|uniref:putative inorganic phosphate cotransporter n=1 Tax=Osmia bicornis bicornis TaxID=1437191 RepID=UPI001EAF6B5C|nr:putative inorganic phosphate cotransporter [Osmia bicornis bicornis]